MIKTQSGLNIKLPHSDTNVEEYDIENKPSLGRYQEKNFIKLKETFEPFNITFGKIWYGTFIRNQSSVINFLIESSDKNVYWRKYEAIAEGGGQNNLYFGKKKIKLTSWLSWTQERRSEFISENL